jgi:hypothetical protein
MSMHTSTAPNLIIGSVGQAYSPSGTKVSLMRICPQQRHALRLPLPTRQLSKISAIFYSNISSFVKSYFLIFYVNTPQKQPNSVIFRKKRPKGDTPSSPKTCSLNNSGYGCTTEPAELVICLRLLQLHYCGCF